MGEVFAPTVTGGFDGSEARHGAYCVCAKSGHSAKHVLEKLTGQMSAASHHYEKEKKKREEERARQQYVRRLNMCVCAAAKPLSLSSSPASLIHFEE